MEFEGMLVTVLIEDRRQSRITIEIAGLLVMLMIEKTVN